MSSRRLYRRHIRGDRFRTFGVTVKESDLWLAVPRESFSDVLPVQVEQLLWQARRELESYIAAHPEFAVTLEPCLVELTAPKIVLEMVRAGNLCGVGPMAAVAGALAEYVGRCLLQDRDEVIVENGGDIFVKSVEEVNVAILAGKSPLSGKMALVVEPGGLPQGISTASGTMGHSYSKGRADAAVALAPCAALADAAATAIGNAVQGPADLEPALALARSIPGVTGAAVICGEKMALWGQVRIRPIDAKFDALSGQ